MDKKILSLNPNFRLLSNNQNQLDFCLKVLLMCEEFYLTINYIYSRLSGDICLAGYIPDKYLHYEILITEENKITIELTDFKYGMSPFKVISAENTSELLELFDSHLKTA